MKYLATIGLEVHVQLNVQSKMFCACSSEYGAAPNTHVCPVCLGYPGAMPVMNQEAIRKTVIAGLMIGCDIPSYSKFDRKSYFYPDMPKNYQITQYDKPLCLGGAVEIEIEGVKRNVQVTRIHLEEDVGKSTHFLRASGVDLNRAGVPLMEIVSEPDMYSPEDAFAYLQSLRNILLYAGVSNCNLEEGNIRCDVNCSVRPEGQKKLGVKTEIKNMNTFKGVYNSLRYEIDRQIDVVQAGGVIRQETRRWDVDSGVTETMRVKEDAHDYRYFPEPDLMPVVLTSDQIDEWRSSLPELPRHRRERFVEQYNLPDYDAGVLVADKDMADYFEKVASLSSNVKAVSNWIMTEMLRLLCEKEATVKNIPLKPAALAELIDLVDKNILNSNKAKEVFAVLFEEGGSPSEIVEQRGLAQVSDTGEIEEFVNKAIEENPKSVQDFLNGKQVAAKFLVGQVMRLSKGKANPKIVGDLIESKLQERS